MQIKKLSEHIDKWKYPFELSSLLIFFQVTVLLNPEVLAMFKQRWNLYAPPRFATS